MRSSIILVLLLSLLKLNTSCSSASVKKEKAYIQISKKACLGRCSVYDLYVFKNGEVHYNGIKNVPRIGSRQLIISKLNLQEIENLFATASFNSIENQKTKRIRDLPNIKISYKNKVITFQGMDIPKEVDQIIKILEELVH